LNEIKEAEDEEDELSQFKFLKKGTRDSKGFTLSGVSGVGPAMAIINNNSPPRNSSLLV
jgi:hypothetical protein